MKKNIEVEFLIGTELYAKIPGATIEEIHNIDASGGRMPTEEEIINLIRKMPPSENLIIGDLN